jgi:hypothetical protein
LTALDYFLWGYLKERVFAHCLQMIDNWKLLSAMKYKLFHRTCWDASWKPSCIPSNSESEQEEDIWRILVSRCTDVCIVHIIHCIKCLYVYFNFIII